MKKVAAIVVTALILNNMHLRNVFELSLHMRGQSPVNCLDSYVKEWGQNVSDCLMTNETSALFHFLDVVNKCKYKELI